MADETATERTVERTPDRTIRWQRLDGPGAETCELFLGPRPTLRGTAAGASDGKPFAVRYEVVCFADWTTDRVEVVVEAAGGGGRLELLREPGARLEESTWYRNGTPAEGLEGCVDVDLAFSPSTNTPPLRRWNLEQGQLGSTRAAWVQFPSLEVRPLDQQFRRIAVDRYRYRSGDAAADFRGAFRTVLGVGADALVTEFPGFWRAVE